MHPYYRDFIESQKILNNDNITMDLETESHLMTYLLQNQKLPGKYRGRDFNPSYNVQDCMDLIEYLFPDYYMETYSEKGVHETQFKPTKFIQTYTKGESKWLARSMFQAIVECFHRTFKWPEV